MSIPKVCIEAAGSPDDYGLAPNYQRDVRKARARCVILALAEEMPEDAVDAAAKTIWGDADWRRISINQGNELYAQGVRIDSLEETVRGMRKALEPWANAARRVNYFDGEGYDARLYALHDAGSALRELCDGIDGRPLCVSDLRRAITALASSESVVKSEDSDA